MPGGCGSPVGSIGGLSCQQVPSQVPVAASGRGSGQGLTFQGQALLDLLREIGLRAPG